MAASARAGGLETEMKGEEKERMLNAGRQCGYTFVQIEQYSGRRFWRGSGEFLHVHLYPNCGFRAAESYSERLSYPGTGDPYPD